MEEAHPFQELPILVTELPQGFIIILFEDGVLFAPVVAEQALFMVSHEAADSSLSGQLNGSTTIGAPVDEVTQLDEFIVTCRFQEAQELLEFAEATVYITYRNHSTHAARVEKSLPTGSRCVNKKRMNYSFAPLSRSSSLNNRAFEPGDKVVTLLHLNETGEVARFDIHLEDLDDSAETPVGPELGRWVREIKDPENDKEAAAARVQSSEALFLSLYGEQLEEAAEADMPEPLAPPVEDGDLSEESKEAKNTLKHLLALMLERKRVLRAIGRRQAEGNQMYLHVKRKKEYVVPVFPLTPETVASLQSTLDDLIF